MRRAVLWDSSAILALLDADDADHRRAVAAADHIVAERRPSFVTNYIAFTFDRHFRQYGRFEILGLQP